IYKFIMTPLNITFLWIIFFIFIIAALVQMLEAVIRKVSPSLYKTMGVYLPLITTNCAVLGVTQLFNGVTDLGSIVKGVAEGVSLNLGWSVLYALFAGVGFTLVMVIMSGLREKLNCVKVSKSLEGFPISMIAASFICMAFMVFAQIKVGG
ncbi:MAG: electron transport complex subunit RsxA, partial [Clostridia bacterium]|nr:electron transport complex subunit RsxA [Clostridia bacterium]